MKEHKPMSEEEYQSLLPSEEEIEKTINELKESFSSQDTRAGQMVGVNCGTSGNIYSDPPPGCSVSVMLNDMECAGNA